MSKTPVTQASTAIVIRRWSSQLVQYVRLSLAGSISRGIDEYTKGLHGELISATLYERVHITELLTAAWIELSKQGGKSGPARFGKSLASNMHLAVFSETHRLLAEGATMAVNTELPDETGAWLDMEVVQAILMWDKIPPRGEVVVEATGRWTKAETEVRALCYDLRMEGVAMSAIVREVKKRFTEEITDTTATNYARQYAEQFGKPMPETRKPGLRPGNKIPRKSKQSKL